MFTNCSMKCLNQNLILNPQNIPTGIVLLLHISQYVICFWDIKINKKTSNNTKLKRFLYQFMLRCSKNKKIYSKFQYFG